MSNIEKVGYDIYASLELDEPPFLSFYGALKVTKKDGTVIEGVEFSINAGSADVEQTKGLSKKEINELNIMFCFDEPLYPAIEMVADYINKIAISGHVKI